MQNLDTFEKEIKQINEALKDTKKALSDVLGTAKKLDAEFQKGANTQDDMSNRIKQVNDNLDILAKSEIEVQKIQKKTSDVIAKARAERTEENKELVKARLARTEQNKKIKEAIQLQKTEAGSIGRLRAENKKLRKERDSINTSTEEGIQRIKEINDLMEANAAIINENSTATEKQRANIGNYKSALDGVPGGLSEIADGTENVAKKFKALLLNPIVAFFAAIVAGATALFNAFKSTRAGSVLLQKGMADVSSAADVGKKRLREWTTQVTSGGEETIKGLLKALTLLYPTLGAITDATDESTKSFRDERKELALLKKELIDLNDTFIDTQETLILGINEARNRADIERAIADDATRSFQERRKAAELARQFSEQAGREEIKLANERLALQEKELEIAMSAGHVSVETGKAITKEGIEIREAFTEAFIAAEDAQNQFQLTVLENQKQRSEIQQDDFEQQLDFLLDIADAQKTVNERRVTDERLSFNERASILRETDNLLQQSYDDQINLFNQQFDLDLDRQKLMELNNKEIFEYARGLGVSEIATNRLREVIKERRLAVQDLADAQRDINDAQLAEIERNTERQILEYRKELVGFKGTQEEKTIAFREFSIKMLELQIQNSQALLEQDTLTAQQRLDIEKQLVEQQIALDEQRAEKTLKNEDLIRESKEKTRDAVIDIGNALFEFGAALNERELANIEAQEEYKLSLVGDNEEAQNRIREDADKKRRQIARRQAVQDKIQGLFNAGINTAIGITKALASLPPPANITLAAVIGALGAVQIATIAAKPLPAFAEGVKDFEGGKAVVGEEGRELISTPMGTFLSPSKATVVDLPAHSDVIPNLETEKIIQGGMSIEKMDQLISETQKTRQAFLGRPIKQTLLTDGGLKHVHKRNNSRTVWLDTYIRS